MYLKGPVRIYIRTGPFLLPLEGYAKKDDPDK
jgi:hypothetical protein